MPAHNLCFRATCGLFLWTFYSFMAERVQFVAQMRKGVITARNKLEVLFFVFVATYFLCCGDVEVNPGPVDSGTPASQEYSTENSSVTVSDNSDTDHSKTTVCSPSAVSPDMATQILEAIRQQDERFQSMSLDMSFIRQDIGSIKADVGHVKAKCDEIGRRCDRLEEDNERLSSSVTEIKEDVHELFAACQQNENNVTSMFSSVENMKKEIDTLTDHCDTLESFSRRDNLRFFGIPQTEKFESYDTCAKLVADTLNSVKGAKSWTAGDIARAHRVGQAREGQPKPMIVKFGRWRDKMTVITDRDYRARLEEKGVRVANDLTRKQASIVAEARKEGKVAFFKKGQLTVAPRRPDPRTYAEVAAADDSADARGTPATTQQPSVSGGEGRGHELGEGRRRDGDSPRRFSEDSQRGSARGARGGYQRSRPGGSRGQGQWRANVTQFKASQSSPAVNKCAGNIPFQPRRSSRITH